MRGQQIYIAWTRYQRRLDSIAARTGMTPIYIPPRFESRWLKPLSYTLQALKTVRVILDYRPAIVWYQLPPNFLTHFILLARFLTAKRFRLVADCHNATFRPPWSKLPGYSLAARHADLVLVHNREVAEDARRLGRNGAIAVLADPPAILHGSSDFGHPARPFILIPCSFHDDEPVTVVLDVARRLQEFDFKITGNRHKAAALGYVQGCPVNVDFTGFVPVEQFNRMLAQCSVLVGLTTREGIQLSVAGEGVGAGKAMVLSDTRILRDLFRETAMLSENTVDALSQAIRYAAADRENLESRTRAFRADSEQRWLALFRQVTQDVNGSLPCAS